MLGFPSDPSLEDLGNVAARAFKASGRSYDAWVRGRNPDIQLENSPVMEMVTSSPGLFAARQVLPYQVSDTELGNLITGVLPENLRQKVGGIRLGGMSEEDKKLYSDARARNSDLRRSTVEIGKVPIGDGVLEADLGPGNYRAKAAQLAGVVGADLAADGVRNIWWFLNAPQAVAQVAMFQGMRDAAAKKAAGDDFLDPRAQLIRNRNLRMAAAAPAWIATSMGIGNFMRQPGYKATIPDEQDPTQTANALGEFANRYFLGRTGSLLPYDEFVQERPDVSRDEYNAYKRYLFSGASPIKATLDGIQGPEVTFMGKSIPLATGIIPMAGAVLGARRGIRRGVDAVNLRGGYALEKKALDAYKALKKEGKHDAADTQLSRLRKIQEINENKVAKSVIANASAYTAGSALSGYVLESMRRALKGKAPQYEEDEI